MQLPAPFVLQSLLYSTNTKGDTIYGAGITDQVWEVEDIIVLLEKIKQLRMIHFQTVPQYNYWRCRSVVTFMAQIVGLIRVLRFVNDRRRQY